MCRQFDSGPRHRALLLGFFIRPLFVCALRNWRALPIIPIAVWSLAPALSLFGVLRILARKRGFPIVLVALLVEATAIISFVAGPMFLLYVFVPLAVTTLLASLAAAPRLRRPDTGS